MRNAGKIGLFLIGAMAAAAISATAQETKPLSEPLFVNYGRYASIRQGDNDHRQAIYLSVPATTTRKLYVRLFDPDTNNSTSFYDQIYRRASTTRTRFTVFGGEGAFIADPSDPAALAKEELSSGTKLAERTFGRERAYDAVWTTVAELVPEQGELVGDRRVFRLLVDAISGVNGNIYDVALSTNADENVAPPGFRMFAYSATIRMPRRGVLTELRFRVPKDAASLTLGNFDAAYGTAFYTTQILSTPLTASGQGDTALSTVTVRERDRGKLAAVTLSGGREYPNDATFFVKDSDGKLIPFELPAEVFEINERPIPVATSDASRACMSVAFDGSESSDPEGASLTYLWRFGDGKTSEGPTATHDYTEEGRFIASLEVFDGSPQLGNGASVDVPVFVKNPPVALSSKRVLVGAGEDNIFYGAPSTARKWNIARHEWDFGDGTTVEGARVIHAYAEPGTYTVIHRVTDDSGHRCNTATEQFDVRVNAKPIAEAGADRRISVGEETVLDASASTDSDGTLVDYRWGFGDGETASGRVVRHAYTAPGTYRVTLAVADDSAVANSGDSDTLTIIVNDPPVPVAGPDRSVAIDEDIAFNGGKSVDRDGTIIAYDWDFGDGATASGVEVRHAYEKSGNYTVRLTVTDDSTTDTKAVSDTLSVRVNEPPVAEAGADRRISVAEVTVLDAGASTDSDGTLVDWQWDFGDGETASGAVVRHAYAKPATYQVKLTVADQSAVANSTDDDTLTIIVNDPPVPEAGPDRSVAIAEDITFNGRKSVDRDGTIIAYDWDFGDGATASGVEVNHAYEKSGNYVVRLTVTDDSTTNTKAVSDTLSVRVNEPPVAEAGADRRISVGEKTVLDAGASTDADGRLVDFFWGFGDGETATGPVVRHAYAKPATYQVRLVVVDESAVANSTDDDTLTIIVNDPPLPEAGPDRSVAVAEDITFNGRKSVDRDGTIIAYDWDFGDGATASGLEVTHAYAKSGNYVVTLTVTDDSTTNTKSVSDTLSVRVNEPPIAEAGPDQLVTASLVEFDGSASSDSDDKVAVYDWDFGDGGKGSGAKPSHVYAKHGTYNVTLTVTDASGTIRSSASDTMQIVVNARPIADAGPDLIGAPGERLVLQASRSLDPDGEIADYQWDFRDGATASGKIVEHAFEKPGTYAVRLKVADNTGHAEAIDYAETEVFINKSPVADAGPDIAAAPGDEVHLSAADSFDSDGEITAYRWDFSDTDEPVEGAEITRVFGAPGAYSAQLTVTDDSGAANNLATDTVRIAINHAPVADAGSNIVTDRSTITFDGTRSIDADGDPLTYKWDFGDGATASGPVVAHTYAAGGTYPVLLTVDDGTGLANATSQTAISVSINRPPFAVAGENQHVCSGDTILLDGSRSHDPEGGVLRYSWAFGDGTASRIVNPTKSYSAGGTYPITLTVTDDSGLANGSNSSQLAVIVDQGPVARAGKDIIACAKTEVRFDGSASTDVDGVVNSFTWDFGDGSVGGGESPTHIFKSPGTYRVFLKIEGEKIGICDSTSTDEIKARIIEGPVAVIKAPTAVPITETVTFDSAASTMAEGKIIDWRWDFGDGETANGETVTHHYSAPGAYQVSLTLTSDSTSPSCQNVATRHVIIINAPPVADAGPDQEVAVEQEVLFDASGSSDADGGITAYEWDFGDGATASGLEVRHRYRDPGTYVARLTVHDNAGLSNSTDGDELTVVVNPAPAPEIAGPGVACVAETVAWKAGDSVNKNATYQWSFGDGASASAHEASHAYSKTGWYSLALSADDGKGLANSRQFSTRKIHVNQPPHTEAGPDQMACPGDTVVFDGSASEDPDGALARFHWDFGDGASSEGVHAEHVFSQPGTYTVTLTATDDAGSSCSATRDTQTVFVNGPPVANAGPDRDVWIGGASDAVLLDGSASSDPDGQALSHTWQIGNGASAFGERVRHTLTEPGDTPVTLTVRDTTGLACGTASTTVKITAKQRN